MTIKNRIVDFLKYSPTEIECVVISDISHARVVLSYSGTKLLWAWKDGGLDCPDVISPIDIHPLAAEALISEEISSFLRMHGVMDNKVNYVNSSGETVDGIIINPPELGNIDFDTVLKKEKIKDLYDRFISNNDSLSEEVIGEAISFGVLSPFLSLVNL